MDPGVSMAVRGCYHTARPAYVQYLLPGVQLDDVSIIRVMPIFTLIGFDHVTRIRQLGNGWIEQKLFTWHLIHRVNCTEYLVGAQLWIEYLWRVYHNASCIHRLPNALLHAALGLVTSDYWVALLHPLFISSLDQWILLAMNPDCAFQELIVDPLELKKLHSYQWCGWWALRASFCIIWKAISRLGLFLP